MLTVNAQTHQTWYGGDWAAKPRHRLVLSVVPVDAMPIAPYLSHPLAYPGRNIGQRPRTGNSNG